MESSISLSFSKNSFLPVLYGQKNANLQFIEKTLQVNISTRGSYLLISGTTEAVNTAANVLEEMYNKAESGVTDFTKQDILAIITNITEDTSPDKFDNQKLAKLTIKTRKKNIFAYNDKQHHYIKTLLDKDVIFGIGAAGTGKTYLAVAVAVSLFIEKKIDRIILTRPAVEAGEKLGFLPGDIKEKVDPYLQPLYDALYEMLPGENVDRYFTTRELQIAPLAFMRGRTLDNAFIILDEAQNTTIAQMKMFLTRLGMGSKMAITGDLTQIDLPYPTPSGLIDAIERLKYLDEIGIVKFDSKDVVRHHLTKKIIDAYVQK